MEPDAETLKHNPAPASEPQKLKAMAASSQLERPSPTSNAAAASLGTGATGMGGGRSDAGDGTGGAGGPDGAGAGDRVYDTVEHPPIPIARVLPVYPGPARSRGLEGEVVLRAIVDQHGAVEPNIVVVESVPLLDQAAIEALRQWRFEPGRDAGDRPVRVLIEVPLRFRLR
jgi:protein TonB